uniref:Hemagglutinin n=1 Tax=Skunkpox virus TaxID=160796 RepID=Q8BEJ1_9POXV|nr:hemagglutinin [Skunkpox virus]
MKQLSIVLLISLVYVYATPHPTTKITKKLGEDATLSCKRNNTEDYIVLSTWYKEPESIILLAVKNDVVYFDGYTSDKVSYDSPYDDLVTTITVKSLTSSDAGTYICSFFITLKNDSDVVDYEEHYIELTVVTDDVSTIDVILSGSTTKDNNSFTEEPHDTVSESNTQVSETFDSITNTVSTNDDSNTISGTPVPDVVTTTPTTTPTPATTTTTTAPTTTTTSTPTTTSTTPTTTTTNDDDLYDVYNDPVSTSSKPTVESGTTAKTDTPKKYTTRDFVEIFGVVSLILLLSMAIFCIVYYYCDKRTRTCGTHIA